MLMSEDPPPYRPASGETLVALNVLTNINSCIIDEKQKLYFHTVFTFIQERES